MLNPDGRLWIDRLAEGLADTGKRLSAEDGERIVRLVAHHVGAEVHPRSPRVSAELPETGERFEGLPAAGRACRRQRHGSRRGLRPRAGSETQRQGRPLMILATNRVRTRIVTSLTVAGLLAATAPALAAGSNMPWEQPLQQILQSIEGPVTKIIAVIIIIVTGLSLAFGDAGGGFRRLIQIVFGLSIAFAASSFFLSFFSFGGGALI
jgi:type IV secretion system protein VirB2